MVDERDPRTYAIIGAAMEVHRELGPGFLESVYHEAMAIEMTSREVPHDHEIDLVIFYKGKPLKKGFRSDFLCFDQVVVEVKAQSSLCPADEAQLINYLKATKHHVGLLLNFGEPSLAFKRMVY